MGRLDELEQRKTELEGIVAVAPLPALRLHPNLAELYRQKVTNLRATLSDESTRAEALEILRGLIERVTVMEMADGGFEIEIIGEIAHMMAITAETRQTKAATQREAAASASFARSAHNEQ
ncbi:MAG: hypothetical protein WD044_09960 [Dongiaceae bacterium]